ncbi:MAG: cell division protein SepF [Prevotella sp.]|nr:cell division protein SepF [Prevotella sp.]
MGLLDTFKAIIGMDPEDDNENDFDTFDNANDDYDDEVGKRNKVVNIHATAQLQVILVKPEVFQDTKQIADHLNSKKTVVLNLESTTPDVTRRIIDFLGGVAYANGGNIKPVANNTFIITPYNVGFVGEDLVGELENNGVFL